MNSKEVAPRSDFNSHAWRYIVGYVGVFQVLDLLAVCRELHDWLCTDEFLEWRGWRFLRNAYADSITHCAQCRLKYAAQALRCLRIAIAPGTNHPLQDMILPHDLADRRVHSSRWHVAKIAEYDPETTLDAFMRRSFKVFAVRTTGRMFQIVNHLLAFVGLGEIYENTRPRTLPPKFELSDNYSRHAHSEKISKLCNILSISTAAPTHPLQLSWRQKRALEETELDSRGKRIKTCKPAQDLRVRHVMSEAALGKRVNLCALDQVFAVVYYEPSRFPHARIILEALDSNIRVYENGYIVITAKSIRDSELTHKHIVDTSQDPTNAHIFV